MLAQTTQMKPSINLWEVPDGQLEFRFGYGKTVVKTVVSKVAMYWSSSQCSHLANRQLMFRQYEDPKVRHESFNFVC